jgi:predicted DNA binding CopG/RHH family protein
LLTKNFGDFSGAEGSNLMAEKKTVRTRNVAFRVTSEEYEQVEKLATEAGLDPNTWCRKVLVDALQEGSGLARNERILYGEIARLRYLVGHGFKLMLGGEKPTAAAWKKITTQVEDRGEEIAAELLSRRKRSAS